MRLTILSLVISLSASAFGALPSPLPTCQEDPQGTASAKCWQACKNQGTFTSTCAKRCGVSTSPGSGSCWQFCKLDGGDSSDCAPLCGTATASGAAACWDACTLEGQSSDLCQKRCG